MIRAEYQDGSFEAYTYNKNGLLLEAENESTTIKLERDKAERVIKEWQDNHWVAGDYDTSGNRIGVMSSLGVLLNILFDA